MEANVLKKRTVHAVLHQLNFHHLHYFWAVAKQGNLTRTAANLRVSQSALSAQIRQLEQQLGVALFERRGRKLVLTEAGEIALAFADDIFTAGTQLLATLHDGRSEDLLRIGTVATLSRNFQESFIQPLLVRPGLRLRLVAGQLDDLLSRLESHALDVVLSSRPARRGAGHAWRTRRIARQPVSVIGRPRSKRVRFPDDLHGKHMILPSTDHEIRVEFDALCEQLGIHVTPLVEVDDMASMRLLARDLDALALLPSVVVRDELRRGELRDHCEVPGLFESFYSITVERRFQHPLVKALLARKADDLLEG